MTQARHVKLFKSGRNQAVRIPRGMELPGEDVIIRREGAKLIIEPAGLMSLLEAFANLPPLTDEMDPIEELSIEPFEL